MKRLFLLYILKGFAKDDILRVATNGTLVLSPQEGPVIVVLKMVGLTEQQTGSHIAWYEREVGTVVAIEHCL